MPEIVEKFVTISGEAPIIGVPVFLIRFSGCNLRCAYCDTIYHTEISEVLSVEALKAEISDMLASFPSLGILFTGGEPLLNQRQDELLSVAKSFPETEFYFETNGSIRIRDFSDMNSHYVMDWKTPSSGNADCFDPSNLEHARITHDCVKFVMNEDDADWVKERIFRIRESKPGLPVHLSPQWGRISPKSLAEFVIENKLPASVSLQLHKIIWGKDARGV